MTSKEDANKIALEVKQQDKIGKEFVNYIDGQIYIKSNQGLFETGEMSTASYNEYVINYAINQLQDAGYIYGSDIIKDTDTLNVKWSDVL